MLQWLALAAAAALAGIAYERNRVSSDTSGGSTSDIGIIKVEPGQSVTVSLGTTVAFTPSFIPTSMVVSDNNVLTPNPAPPLYKASQQGRVTITAMQSNGQMTTSIVTVV